MKKRIFTLILVAIIGILIGVGVVTKQAREPLLREILERQTVLLHAQNRMEKKLAGDGAAGDIGISTLLAKQKDLEKRLAVLESQWKNFKKGGGNVRQAPPEDRSKVYDIPVAHSPVKGNKNAPVTIVEFVDFQCPFCARFHPPVVEAMKAYPQEVNYVLKNFPLSFHSQAKPAAKAAFAAGEQGKYWAMVDALLENGKELSDEKFKALAKELGLDVKKFMKDYKNKDAQWEGYIQKDMDLAGKMNVRATPTFYINGRKTNVRDFNGLKAEIDNILRGKK